MSRLVTANMPIVSQQFQREGYVSTHYTVRPLIGAETCFSVIDWMPTETFFLDQYGQIHLIPSGTVKLE